MFEEIQQLVSKESGIELRFCKICGASYKPRNSRQKTCGAPECRKAWNRVSQRNTIAKKSPAQLEEYKRRHAESNKKWREKQQKLVKYSDGLRISEEKYNRLKHFDDVVEAHGLHYGDYQKERTLAITPKIDVEQFLKEVEESKKNAQH